MKVMYLMNRDEGNSFVVPAFFIPLNTSSATHQTKRHLMKFLRSSTPRDSYLNLKVLALEIFTGEAPKGDLQGPQRVPQQEFFLHCLSTHSLDSFLGVKGL